MPCQFSTPTPSLSPCSACEIKHHLIKLEETVTYLQENLSSHLLNWSQSIRSPPAGHPTSASASAPAGPSTSESASALAAPSSDSDSAVTDPSASASASVLASPSQSTSLLASGSPRKKGKHSAGTPQLKQTLIGKILLGFQKASLGSKFRLKDRENARTKRGHAERIATYMAAGEDEILGLWYLYNPEKLQAWRKILQAAGYRVTSIKAILLNVRAFLRHMDMFHKDESQLTSSEIGELLNLIKSLQSLILKEMAAHHEKETTSTSEAAAEEMAWGEFGAASPPEGQEHHQADQPDAEEEVVGKRRLKKRLFLIE
ncbi:uncharacterized protein LOC117250203 [Epinephelus lanceolatus]